MPQFVTVSLTAEQFQEFFEFPEPSGLFNDARFRLVINKFGRCYWLLACDNLQGPRFSGVNVYYQGNNARLIRTIYPKARRIIDVGANVGNNTIAYAEWAEFVEAFEPTPTTLTMLRANIDIAARSVLFGTYWHGTTRHGQFARDITQPGGWFTYKGQVQPMDIVAEITVHDVALTNRNIGTIGIQDHPEHGGHNYTVYTGTEVKRSQHVINVASRTIDSYNFDQVDVIKIDVEGSELLVIEGADQTIDRCRPSVQVEIVPKQCARYGYQPQDIFDYFASKDYVCVCAVRRPLNRQHKELGLHFGKDLGMTHQQISKYMDRLFVPRELHQVTDYGVINQVNGQYDSFFNLDTAKQT